MTVAVGVLLAILIDRLTEYFTGTEAKPVQSHQESCGYRPGDPDPAGCGGWLRILGLVGGRSRFDHRCFHFHHGDYPGSKRMRSRSLSCLYGVAMAGIGMLTLTGNNVAMDSFGPIADNANGIGEMSWSGMEDKETRDAQQIMADLDAVGNTTKAITKGVAIGSAVIAAVSLFGSFIVDVGRVDPTALANGIRVNVPQVFVGMLIGGALPWLFSSFAIQAVSRAAALIVEECRRQFKLGVLEGKVKPDYAKAVSISTTAAQKELIGLALLGIVTPIVVGLMLQVEALGGFLAGIILSGQLLAVFLNNSGGAWDNAKKLIEDEPRSVENNTGKGSERHKAGVVGDTVGDPFKDTAGPALNPMIKVVNLVALIVAPIVVTYKTLGFGGWVVVVLLLGVLTWSVIRSKAEAPALK